MKKLFNVVVLIAITLISCEKNFSSSKYEIGRVNVGTAYRVKISGNNAYVGNNDGVVVIDITNPEKPKKVTTLRTNEAVFGIFIEENTLFVGSSGSQNLRAYDISNPNEPVLLSSITFNGSVVGICKNGKNLFAATLAGYLMVIDVSDLTNMNLIKSHSCSGQGSDLLFNQNYIYYANAQNGLEIIDVSEPENPALIETMGGTRGAWSLDILNKDNSHQLCPNLSPDGKYLFYTSQQTGSGNTTFWVDAKIIEELKPKDFK